MAQKNPDRISFEKPEKSLKTAFELLSKVEIAFLRKIKYSTPLRIVFSTK
jgi:hypothetical protein